MKNRLDGLSEIRGYFFRDPTPIWYVDPSGFNMLGMDEWVRGFRYVTFNDCFDGAHPRTFVPPREHDEVFPFETLEEMNDYLIRNPAVADRIRARGSGRALFLLFDETIEAACRELELELCLPSAELRRSIDDKVEATRIASRAGVAAVPNVLAHVESYRELREVAASLGQDLVIQTPFGDSGTTTYFVSDRDGFEQHQREIASQSEVKIMKRIRCRQGAQEACVTRQGTIVGPLMTEIVGFPELTPYTGGWAGNEVAAGSFPDGVPAVAAERTARVGDELRNMGYRGYFEIDWLLDDENGELYLGEINPRLTGASSMTNLAAFAHADAPLVLFHLLEFSDIDFRVDVARLNARWADPENMDAWGQLILKRIEPGAVRLREAPPSGVWRMNDDGEASFRFAQTHRRTVDGDSEAFFLRIAGPGDVVHPGDDIGILVLRGRLMTPDYRLTRRALQWNGAIRRSFSGEPIPTED